MKRYMKAVVGVVLFTVVWLLVLTGKWRPVDMGPREMGIVQILPMYLLVSFGAYSLGVIGYNLARFRDCPQAREDLKSEIADANADLKARGYSDVAASS